MNGTGKERATPPISQVWLSQAVWLPVILGVGSFVVTRILIEPTLVTSTSAIPPVLSKVQTVKPTISNSAKTPRKRVRLGVTLSDDVADWSALVSSEPSLSSKIINALVMESSRRSNERGASPYDCNPDEELLGRFVLDFRVEVESTRNQLRSKRWRFAKVIEGSPLSKTVIACLEQVVGPDSFLVKGDGFPDGFSGEVPIRYRMEFSDGDD